VSRYLVDKFLYRVDRDERALSEYMIDPFGFVAVWETGDGLRLHEGEVSTGLSFTDEERTALQERDYRTLYQLGAHPFILFTLMIAVYQPEYDEFIVFAHVYRERVAGLGWPDYAT
jgi:hypothetical protein